MNSNNNKSKIVIDFTNEIPIQLTINNEVTHKTALQFYEKRSSTGQLIEHAYILEDSNTIKFMNSYGDVSEMPAKNINEFIFNIYNNIKVKDDGYDVLKKRKNSKPYYEIKVLGKKIPLGVFLFLDEESYSINPFSIMDLDYKINNKKDNEAKINMLYNFTGGDETSGATTKYLSLYPKNTTQENFANSLNMFKFNKFATNKEGLSGIRELFFKKLIDKYGEGALTNIIEISNRFIDGSSRKILKDYGYNTQLSKIYSVDMVNMLNQRTPKSQFDLDNYRLRMSEAVTSVAYKQMGQAIKKFKSISKLSNSKIEIKKSYITDELISAGILQYSKTLNPLEEAMLSLKVTKTGIGNVLKNQVTLNRRDINQSYFGTIGPTSTNEYGGIGVNQTLTNGALINSRFGEIKKKKFSNDSNPFENLSPVESLSAFFEYDDTTRRVMGNQQTSQFIQLQNPDVPLVQTGFESYMPHLVSDRFTKKAKKDGVIESVTSDNIKIKYSDGTIENINTKMVKSRTKRGIFIGNEYTNLVQKGQTVKAGDIISSCDSMKSGKLAIGKNLVVAEMGYMGMNFEDGWVVSDTLSKKYSNSVLQKIIIPIPVNSLIKTLNIEEGKNTQSGEVLFEYTTSENLDLEDDETDENENMMIGLETRGNSNIYKSPGGIIKEVVVKINNKNMNKQIMALHKKLTDPMRLKIERCIKDSKEADIGISDNKAKTTQKYSDCVGHLENSESLVIGGHKVNQVEIDGAFIEIYIEKENPVINGSKFTLTSSGGKGTVQYVMAHGQEPITEETNLKVEFVGTSLSIISRKNPSILLSLYLGKVIYFLNRAVLELAKQGKILAIKKLVLEIFTAIDKTADHMLVSELNEFFKAKNNTIIKFINSRDPLNNPAFPAIVPPFKNKITIKDIQAAANILGIPLNEKIKIVENNGIVTVKDVPVGILPVHLLEHFPKAMSSVRGGVKTGKDWVTGQGRSGTKEGTGATKVGLFDMNSLISKQADGLLQELHTYKSDAGKAKKQMLRTITRENRIPTKYDIELNDEDLTSKNMVDNLFKGAGLEFGF